MVKDSRTPAGAGGLLPMNLPVPALVDANRENEPVRVVAQGKLRRVTAIPDRWRIDDEWWREEISRQYFAVETEGGIRLTVFQDLITGDWFEQRYTPPARIAVA